MLTDPDVERLRSLVRVPEPEPEPESPQRGSWRRVLRLLGLTLGTSLVLGSVVFMGWVSWSEFLRADDTATTTVAAEEATAAPVVSPISDDPFAALRYLPAGAPDGFHRQSIIGSTDAAPIAAFARLGESGGPDAIVIIDANATPLAMGPGVPELTVISVGELEGVVFGAGTAMQNVAVWDHPDLGALRAWGTGLDKLELADFLDELEFGVEDATVDPWVRVEEFEGSTSDPVWRASYVSDRGQALVITAHATSDDDGLSVIDTDSCESTRVRTAVAVSCPGVLAWNNDDGVEIVIFGEAEIRQQFAEVLRSATVNDARVRSGEIDPMARLDFDSAPKLLYLASTPGVASVEATLMHSSGETATTPAFVLVERANPVLGRITGAVVVSVLPDRSARIGRYEDDHGVVRIVFEEAGRLVQLSATNHTLDELAVMRFLITSSATGDLEFVSSIGERLGVERQYESTFINPDPAVITQGPVFGATYITDSGETVNQTVSFVPGYAPEGVIVVPHENNSVPVRVRSATGSFLIADGVRSLTWEEAPGILITLSMPQPTRGLGTARKLLEIASDLQPVSAQDIRLGVK